MTNYYQGTTMDKKAKESQKAVSAAGMRARKKYVSNNVKQLNISFFPKDHDVYEAFKVKAKEYGGNNKYIIDLIKKDLNIEEKN